MTFTYLLIAFVLGFLVAFQATKEHDRDWYRDEMDAWNDTREPLRFGDGNGTIMTEFVSIDGDGLRRDPEGILLKPGEYLQWQARDGYWNNVPSDRYRVMRQVPVPRR